MLYLYVSWQTMGRVIFWITSYVLEIPNDAYTTLRQSKIDWLSNTQSRVPQADWLMLVNNEKATFNIKMPFWIIILS